jgi:RNA polymerase sigma-70 factor, ECF subfamily
VDYCFVSLWWNNILLSANQRLHKTFMPPNTATDAVLYAHLRLQKPEEKPRAEQAFGELYRRHAGRVNAYCKRVLGGKEEASDVFQETFARFYQSAQTPTEREMTNVPAYLLTIARNLCLQHKRNTRTTFRFEDFDFPDPHHHSLRRLEETELLSLITTALELLDFDHREAFVLREYDGFSYQEIAELVNSNEATIRTRAHRAKLKLREILSPYLHDLKK